MTSRRCANDDDDDCCCCCCCCHVGDRWSRVACLAFHLLTVYFLSPKALTGTGCCSTDSERPHRCCHLPNNFGSLRIFLVLCNGSGDAHQIAPFPVIFVPPPTTWSRAHPSPHPKRDLDWISRLNHGCDQQTYTHTQTATTTGRIYALCACHVAFNNDLPQ